MMDYCLASTAILIHILNIGLTHGKQKTRFMRQYLSNKSTIFRINRVFCLITEKLCNSILGAVENCNIFLN